MLAERMIFNQRPTKAQPEPYKSFPHQDPNYVRLILNKPELLNNIKILFLY